MNKRNKLELVKSALLVFALSGFAGLAAAQLEIQRYQDIPFVTGGVGLEEREALERMEASFNLKLTFALSEGNYLSDVQVRILDGQGAVVLDGVADGPLFYANLPPGMYTVQVSGFGRQFEKTARVSGQGLRELAFYWP